MNKNLNSICLIKYFLYTDLFSNAITFRIADSVILLPTFDLGHSGDIYFEFRTTQENAVLLHSKVKIIV